MATYAIRFTSSARKEFERLPRRIQDKAIELLSLLSTNPFSEFLHAKKLKGPEALFRVRLGDYRLLYEVRAKELLVFVVKLGHRREIYRRLK